MSLEFKVPGFLRMPAFRIPGTPRFNLPLLCSMIKSRGVPIRWDKSLLCPCIDTASEGPDPSCTVCRGMGVFWDTSESKETTALVTSRQWNRNQVPAPHGVYDQGTASVTFLPGFLPAMNDRIVVTCDKVVYADEILIKGNSTPTGESLERVLAEEILGIEKLSVVRRIPPTGTPYVTESKDFFEGTHFYVADKNKIMWYADSSLDEAPADGEPYAIRYIARPEWIIFGSPQPLFRSDSNTPVDELPVRASVNRIDFVKRRKGA